jgi:PIN domain nuclease of toxin-antitoxin system
MLLSRKINLPHQDPADRFIAATASVFGLILITETYKAISSTLSQVRASTVD